MSNRIPIRTGALLLFALAAGAAGCGDSNDGSPATDAAADVKAADAAVTDAAAADAAPADAAAPDLASPDTLPDAAPADVALFVGDWLVTMGMAQATMCDMNLGDLPAQSLEGKMVTVAAGTDAAIELTLGGCTFKFDVMGNVATARAGQSCMTKLSLSGVMFDVTLSFESSTFTVVGNTGSLVQTGHAVATNPVMVMCAYKANAAGMKVMPAGDGGAADASDGGAADAADAGAADAAATDAAATDAAAGEVGADAGMTHAKTSTGS